MSEVRSLFENHSFQSKCHEAYSRMVLAHDTTGMQNLQDWLDSNGWNVHVVVNQLTIWNKSTRSPLAPRIVVDTHGAVWGGLAATAKAVHSAAYHKAYFFDELAVHMLKEAMKNDPDCVDQSSQATADRSVD